MLGIAEANKTGFVPQGLHKYHYHGALSEIRGMGHALLLLGFS